MLEVSIRGRMMQETGRTYGEDNSGTLTGPQPIGTIGLNTEVGQVGPERYVFLRVWECSSHFGKVLLIANVAQFLVLGVVRALCGMEAWEGEYVGESHAADENVRIVRKFVNGQTEF